MKRFLKRGGEEILRHGKKKIPHSPAQPSPTEKQKLKSRQPLSPSLLQPGDARGPQKQPQSSESPRKDLGGAVHQQPSREKYANGTLPAADRKRGCGGTASPPPPRPSGDGAQSPSPNKATSTQFCRGPAPAPALPRGTPPQHTPSARPELPQGVRRTSS